MSSSQSEDPIVGTSNNCQPNICNEGYEIHNNWCKVCPIGTFQTLPHQVSIGSPIDT